MLNAFCRVAPWVRFKTEANFRAGVFNFASDLSSRTFTDVQVRLFFPFFIQFSIMSADACSWKRIK